MTNNHTPGPWAVEKPRTRSIITSGYKIVAILESGHTDADAQLMAAAPDLLAACEAAEDVLSRLYYATRVGQPGDGDVLTIVRAAIAKAKPKGE